MNKICKIIVLCAAMVAPISYSLIAVLILMTTLHDGYCLWRLPYTGLQRSNCRAYRPSIGSGGLSRSTKGDKRFMLRATEGGAVDELVSGRNAASLSDSPRIENAAIMASLLRNISTHMDLSSTEKIFGFVSQRLDWLLSTNMSLTMQTMLEQNVHMRDDQNMMQAYAFLLDVLEKVSERSSAMTVNGAALLSELLLAANSTEAQLEEYIELNERKLLGPDFQVFLDSQIEQAEKDGALDRQSVLETAKLLLLKQMGNKYGEFIKALSELVIEEEDEALEVKVMNYLRDNNVLTPDRLKEFLHTTQQGIHELATQADVSYYLYTCCCIVVPVACIYSYRKC